MSIFVRIALPLLVLSWIAVVPAEAAKKPAAPAKKTSDTSKSPLPLDAARIAAIAAMLPEAPTGVGRPLTDRAAWEKLAATGNYQSLIRGAERSAKEPIPEVPDELYLEFSRNGNRTNYQNAEGKRRGRLTNLVIGECLENKGRFLPATEALVRVLCAEKSWTLPAHDRGLKNFKGEELDIDLASSALGWELATMQYWLGEKLSPEIRKLVRGELERRIFRPYRGYLERGRPRMWWATGTNNWNAVCTAGVIGTALATLASREERAIYVAAAEKSNAYFLSGFTADGYCSEGLGYWNYGFGNFQLLAETVKQATGGKLDWMESDKVRAVARFGQKIEIQNGISPAFADCGVGDRPSPMIMGFDSRRYGWGWHAWEEAAFGAKAGPAGGLASNGVYRFDNSALRAAPASAGSTAMPMRDWFQEAAILVCRPAPEQHDALGAAFKGGFNDGSHHHHDVGSFVVALGHSTPILDPGGEVYTARTFSAKRFQSQMLNSFGHPVPRVAGMLQSEGRAAEAQVVKSEFTPEADKLVLEIRSAYAVPGLKKLQRTFLFSRTGRGSLTVTDEVEFDRPQAFGTALLTYSPWKDQAEQILLIGQKPDVVQVEIKTLGGSPQIHAEEIHEDASHKKMPLRLGIDLDHPVAKGAIRLVITPR